jgi:hypothetical protein
MSWSIGQILNHSLPWIMILYNTVLWYYTFGQFHGNVTLVTKFLIYIFENNKSYVQNEAYFRKVRWELNYFTKKCNILNRFLVDFYVTNIRLLWKCPFRLQRYSFITTLFFRSLWWRYNQILLYINIFLILYTKCARNVYKSYSGPWTKKVWEPLLYTIICRIKFSRRLVCVPTVV